jgi:hypothetical protein
MSALRVNSGTRKQKDRPKAVSVFEFDFRQAASIALLRRRYAIAPIPAKPRIIIAHVDGSGTAAIAKVDVPEPKR